MVLSFPQNSFPRSSWILLINLKTLVKTGVFETIIVFTVYISNNVDLTEIFRLEVWERVLFVLPGKFRSFQNLKWKSFWSLKVKTMRSMIFPRQWLWGSFGPRWRMSLELSRKFKIFISVERSSMTIATCAITKL